MLKSWNGKLNVCVLALTDRISGSQKNIMQAWGFTSYKNKEVNIARIMVMEIINTCLDQVVSLLNELLQ